MREREREEKAEQKDMTTKIEIFSLHFYILALPNYDFNVL
jgi:hypothetical protein